ncbi:MAG TPA: multidrug effflux MFS transporter [Deinococcales bacterium]|nr:multidrug effflux MFS transporter [Deinococcales bacterium]
MRRPSTLLLLFTTGALMTVSALAMDVMLPAFPTMAADLGVNDAQIQRVLIVFTLGYALPHLMVGSAADRYGRRPVLVAGLLVYALGSIMCLLANDYTSLLTGRFIQGMGSAAAPVLARAVLRDLYSGRELGRMMSFAMVFFSAAPLIAPTIGALILGLGDWHLLFVFLLVVAVFMLGLVLLVLPETLPERDPDALSPKGIFRNARTLFTDPRSAWSVVILTMGFGTLMAYLSSAPGIYINHYGLNEGQFALVFAVISAISFVAQPLNARLLNTYTPVQILRVVLPVFVAVALVLVFQTALGLDTVWSFAANFMAFFACFSITLANSMTMVLEPHHARAGMASGVSGFVQLGAGTILGSVIGFFAAANPVGLAVGIAVLLSGALFAFPFAARAYADTPL